MLRYIFPILILLISGLACASEDGIVGKIESVPDCAKNVMVWLSLDKSDYKHRLLLMHTEVPVGGQFQFYLKPGQYQLRATDEKGCEFLSKVRVTSGVMTVLVRMKK